jgi:hypothetical protein
MRYANITNRQENISILPLQQIEEAAVVSLVVHDLYSDNPPYLELLEVFLDVSRLKLFKIKNYK